MAGQEEPGGIVASPLRFDDVAEDTGNGTRSTVRMRVWRGDESGGHFKEYVLPANEGEVVLDVVHRIQAEQAPDLAVRWNCKAGKCGSCSAEINGRPSLMCMTRMSTLPPGETVTVTPMRGFPIIRDLVADVSFNYEVAKRIPAFKPGPREPDGTYRMQQVDIDRVQEFHKCIECFLCQNVCHVIRDHEENKQRFAGPRLFVRLAALEMHPLDTNDRRALIREKHAIGLCNITKCCTEVCPEHIHITDNAIIPLKERVVDVRYDPIAWLGRKLRRRPPPKSAEETYKETPAYRASVTRQTTMPANISTRPAHRASSVATGAGTVASASSSSAAEDGADDGLVDWSRPDAATDDHDGAEPRVSVFYDQDTIEDEEDENDEEEDSPPVVARNTFLSRRVLPLGATSSVIAPPVVSQPPDEPAAPAAPVVAGPPAPAPERAPAPEQAPTRRTPVRRAAVSRAAADAVPPPAPAPRATKRGVAKPAAVAPIRAPRATKTAGGVKATSLRKAAPGSEPAPASEPVPAPAAKRGPAKRAAKVAAPPPAAPVTKRAAKRAPAPAPAPPPPARRAVAKKAAPAPASAPVAKAVKAAKSTKATKAAKEVKPTKSAAEATKPARRAPAAKRGSKRA